MSDMLPGNATVAVDSMWEALPNAQSLTLEGNMIWERIPPLPIGRTLERLEVDNNDRLHFDESLHEMFDAIDPRRVRLLVLNRPLS
jgi:hypothetical protein